MARLWLYGRTSGEEDDTGQDVGAQLAQIRSTSEKAGHQVLGESCDDGVSGDVRPLDRPGWVEAVRAIQNGQADAICIREASRFSRQPPWLALTEWQGNAAPILCLGESHFTTLGEDQAAKEEPTRVIMRFIGFWQSWTYLLAVRSSTQKAMTELKEGRRPTKSGKAVGRPEKELSAAELEKAREILAAPKGSLSAAARQLSMHRGFHLTSDSKLKRDRTVSRDTLSRALGLRDAAQKADLRKTPDDQDGAMPAGNGPVLRNGDVGESGSAALSDGSGATGGPAAGKEAVPSRTVPA